MGWLGPAPLPNLTVGILSILIGTVQAATPLFDNLGSLHRSITTTSEAAQQYFDQGLRLVYAFNHEEAIRSFEEAARLDPLAPMPQWGIALALGPNINAPMSRASEHRAVAAIRSARAHLDRANEVERAYIEALTKRYVPTRRATRASMDKAYADAMREVWRQYPDDPEAGVLFAEALMDLRPWDLWAADGKPRSGTDEIITTLEAVLEKNPEHPGACHYYIHALEASPQPDRALECADKLPGLMPGAGHLVHMPAHIYARVGRYHEASECNATAVNVDRRYLSQRRLSGDYADTYYSHNLHFLWASLMMEGRSEEALDAADALLSTITEKEVRRDRSKEPYLSTKLFAMIRFGRWEDLLAELPPPKGLRLQEAIWRLGRGLALVATGRLPGAEGELYALSGLAKRFRRTRNPEEKLERDMIETAERLLEGSIAARRRRYDDAIKTLSEGVKLEESLPYSEPAIWPLPVRHYLGPVFLLAGRASDAEVLYRTDLIQSPENGWALLGLSQSLLAQQKDSEAAEVTERFERAWAHADVSLAPSRF